MKRYIPLKKFYEDRLSQQKEIDPKDMGVICDMGHIGGYLNAGDYRKPETFSDIEKRRQKVNKLLERYK